MIAERVLHADVGTPAAQVELGEFRVSRAGRDGLGNGRLASFRLIV